MRSAIYYPHTELKNVNLLKTCLLLWDNVEFIVPFADYRPHYGDRSTARAIELIGKNRCPTDLEKKKAHSVIEDFATGSLPDSFFYSDNAANSYYRHGIWPQKFLPETFDMLLQLRLVGNRLPNADYPLQDAVGLALMSILTDCCAGETRTRVTDRGAAYASLTNLLTDENEARSKQLEYIIPLTLKLIETSDVPLENLVAFREREFKENGHTLRELRRNYVNRIALHLKEVSNTTSKSDLDLRNEQFEVDMRDDMANLRQEITGLKQDVVLSKEFLVTAVGAVGGLWAAMHGMPVEIAGVFGLGGPVVAAGGLAATGRKYSAARITTLKKHPMAYLYELQKQH